MQQKISLHVLPSEAANEASLLQIVGKACAAKPEQITGYNILKKSIDARSRTQVWINLTLQVFIDEPFQIHSLLPLQLKDVHGAAKKVIVVGAGPAGLFAAIKLIEAGIQPIVLERGKDVRSRRRDLAAMNKEGVVNEESNYCFGEGGAGTYSDGKLYTRSNKRGDIQRILSILVHFGADEKILYEAHPHIGTNKLPHIIVAMREKIQACGGQVLFSQKVTDLIIGNNQCTGVIINNESEWAADAVILATGHSARDIFYLLHKKKLEIAFKPYALGVRIEHPQTLIDAIQYHLTPGPSPKERRAIQTLDNGRNAGRGEHLPPASYSLVQQVAQKGVFSFCMCPGGIIAPAATAPGEVVVNGWSPSKRNNPYANSGMVVTADYADLLHSKDLKTFIKENDLPDNKELLGLHFQTMVEQDAFAAGGGNLAAPAQRMDDFVHNRVSQSLPQCSYLPGIAPADLRQVLPQFVHKALRDGFKEFGKKMRGYLTNEAVIVATESRTSSPVRIPRDAETLAHPQAKGLYPCGEGAGYAGGIVSAAMDGERVAAMIAAMIAAGM